MFSASSSPSGLHEETKETEAPGARCPREDSQTRADLFKDIQLFLFILTMHTVDDSVMLQDRTGLIILNYSRVVSQFQRIFV